MRENLNPRLIGIFAVLVFLPLGLAAQPTSQRAATSSTSATDDSLLINRERAQWEALKRKDTTAFARLMGGDLVDVDLSGIKRTSPATTSRYVMGCETTSYALADVRVARYAATAVVTYTVMLEQTCWGQKAPSPLFVMTVYERRGGEWEPVAHSETAAAHW
jgi:ketosteroid isomerase-like protein